MGRLALLQDVAEDWNSGSLEPVPAYLIRE
jgi:hypothetical protein